MSTDPKVVAVAGGTGWEARYQAGRDDVTLDAFQQTVTAMRDLRVLSQSGST